MKQNAMRLDDTALVVLSAAARREDLAIDPSEQLKGAAGVRLAGRLLRAGLIVEVPAAGGLPVWRRAEGEGPVALRVTPAALATLGIEDAAPPDRTARKAAMPGAPSRGRKAAGSPTDQATARAKLKLPPAEATADSDGASSERVGPGRRGKIARASADRRASQDASARRSP